MIRLLRPAALAAAFACLSSPAWAQSGRDALEALDPEVTAPKAPAAEPPSPPAKEEAAPPSDPSPAAKQTAPGRPSGKGSAPAHPAPTPPAAPTTAAAPPAAAAEPLAPPQEQAAPSAPPKRILAPALTDQHLRELFAKLQKKISDLDWAGVEKLGKELLSARDELGADRLEPFSAALIRQAHIRADRGDSAYAVHLASLAVDLSPSYPPGYFALAQISWGHSASSLRDWVGPLAAGLSAWVADPRYARPLLANLGLWALLAGLLLSAVCAVALFARGLRRFLHDLHHLFPRASSPWLSAGFALLLLSLPLWFRSGVGPALAGLLLCTALHLAWRERLLSAGLLLWLGLTPWGAGLLVQRTVYAGSAAEEVQRLEGGSLDARSASERVRGKLKEEEADPATLFALGRYAVRRGKVEEGIPYLERAALMRPNDGRTLVNLGNALLLKGDEAGALAQYEMARKADPLLAAAPWNLSRALYRKGRTDPEAQEQAGRMEAEAQALDPQLLARGEDRAEANLLLLSPRLPAQEISALVAPAGGTATQAQVARLLWGTPSPGRGILDGAGLALLLLALGGLASLWRPSRACEKCGNAACARCDPELPERSGLCNQCIHVFSKAGADVPAPVKVSKQLEVSRYRIRRERFTYALGFLFAGAGHLFSGRPFRGALYALGFAWVACALWLRTDQVRLPAGDGDSWLWMLPLALCGASLYLLSLRDLRKAM